MKNRYKAMIIICFIVLVCASGGVSSVLAASSDALSGLPERTLTFDIAPQPLNSAISQVAEQADVNVAFYSDLGRRLRSRRLIGRFTVVGAFKELLAGAPLRADFVDPQSVVIREASSIQTSNMLPPNATPALRLSSATSDVAASAQHDTNSDLPSSSAAESNGDAEEKSANDLREIVVTGTRIHGVTPASPVIVIDRAAIDQSGYATTGDLIRSLPQSFGGGTNPGVNGTGQTTAAYNFNSASSANLRGFGSDATLTLVNGHRLAFSGISDSVDISTIPLAAVDRVEIVTDGASALYGSDAVAGVVNVILKSDFEGSETSVRYGASTQGGGDQRQIDETAGMAGSRGGFVASYEYFSQSPLLTSQRDFSSQAYSPTSLIPDDDRSSGLFSGHFNINDSMSIFGDAMVTRRDPHAVGGFGPVFVATQNPTNQYGLATGLRFDLPNSWSSSVTGTVARDSQINSSYYNGIGFPQYSFKNNTMSGEAEATGHVFELPSGPLSAAIDSGYRREATEVNFLGFNSNSRSIIHAALELNVPLVAPNGARPGLNRLELSLADRYEHYSDFGATNNPKVGLIYAPWSDITLKGTWGRSFHAPGLYEQYGVPQTTAVDAAALGVAAPGKVGLEGVGGNPKLGPETAHEWSTSIEYKPQWLSGARATLSGYRIDYRNRITQPINNFVGILGNPIYTPFIVNNPSAQLIAAVTSPPYDFQNYSSATTFSPANVFAYYEGYYQNIARQVASGVDLLFDYRLETGVGLFTPGLNFTHTKLVQYALPGSPAVALSGTIFNVPNNRARASVNWTLAKWSASAFLNYVSSETDNTATYIMGSPAFDGHVASWTTIDTQLTYTVRWTASAVKEIQFALSVQNLLDRAPPSIPQTSTTGSYAGLGFDPANASPLGRFVAATFSTRF